MPGSHESVGVGLPVAVTVKEPADPTVKVVALAEVMAGAESTVRVKDWVASGLHAVGGGDGDRVGAAGARAGVPARVAVPSPLSTKVTPVGRAPVSVSEAVGLPVDGHGEGPGDPSVKVALVAEVMRGRRVDGQGEGLGGVGADPVGGGDGERVGPAGPLPGCRPGWPCRRRCR